MKFNKNLVIICLHVGAVVWLYVKGFLPDILAELAKDLQTLSSLI